MDTRRLRSIVLVLAAALTAAGGCSQQAAPPRAKYTVDEYLAKPDLMEAKVRECANNPGELRDDPDCVNVKAAAQQYSVGSRKRMEPLKFPSREEMNASTKRDPSK
ncbi:MAG: EexN family lipoprotein [Proteobacteria bacterium]|nr:EexN family lipoprotein [Pseudomonadota bacterium]